MENYFDSMKDELKEIRMTQEFMLTHFEVGTPKPDLVSENKKSAFLLPEKIEITKKKRYLSEEINLDPTNLCDFILDSNKRLLK